MSATNEVRVRSLIVLSSQEFAMPVRTAGFAVIPLTDVHGGLFAGGMHLPAFGILALLIVGHHMPP